MINAAAFFDAAVVRLFGSELCQAKMVHYMPSTQVVLRAFFFSFYKFIILVAGAGFLEPNITQRSLITRKSADLFLKIALTVWTKRQQFADWNSCIGYIWN